MRFLGILALVAGATASWTSDARGFSGGAAGNPVCNSCHSGAPAPSVSFMSNNAAVTALSVPKGSTVQLTLRVKPGNPTQRNTGFNVASSNSTATLSVAADPGTKATAAGEVTQSSRRLTNAQGFADFPFKVTGGNGAVCGSSVLLTGQGLATLAPVTGGRAATATLTVTVTCP